MEQPVSLRPLTRHDVEHFYTWASDPEVARTMTWEAYTSLAEAEKFLIDVAVKHPWFKAICVDGVPVGSITLTQGKGNLSCKAELGYVLAKAYWGKGIATSAAKLAIQMGFKDPNIQRIEALVDPANTASKRVLIKAGMTYEGLLKNYMFFKNSVCDRRLYAITQNKTDE